MNPLRAKEILDELDIKYKDVRRGSFLYVVMPDDSHVPFNRVIREHKLHVQEEVSDILFSPHPEHTKPVNNEVTQAETEVIVKKKKSKSKNNK
jgi:hypothetical protein